MFAVNDGTIYYLLYCSFCKSLQLCCKDNQKYNYAQVFDNYFLINLKKLSFLSIFNYLCSIKFNFLFNFVFRRKAVHNFEFKVKIYYLHKNELVREDKLFCFLYGYGFYNFFLYLLLITS